MFILFSGKYGQKHEIMDKNFESTYEHLSEPRNVYTIFWKMWTKIWNYGQTFRIYLWTFNWTQKCSYNFPENVDKNMKLWTNISSLLMNIQMNPESMDNYSLSLDNIVHIFWKIVWTFESMHEYLNEPRKCFQEIWMGLGDVLDFKTQICLMETWNHVQLLRWCNKNHDRVKIVLKWPGFFHPVAWVIKF